MIRNRKDRQHHAAGQVLEEIARLLSLDLDQLRRAWKLYLRTDPPSLRSHTVLRQLLTWEMQALALGGLDRKTERTLEDIADRLERDGNYEPKIRRGLSPGIELAREWKGVIHKVTVVTGGFQYLGKRCASLSDIARTITGTRWSGPRFFGLEQRKRKSYNKSLSASARDGS